MKAFFNKYADTDSEKMALKMIHKKLHKIIEDEKRTKEDIIDLYRMICDFAESAGIDLPDE